MRITTAIALAAALLPGAAFAQSAARPHGGPMMRADADGDGTVTRTEAMAEAEAAFTRADADRDGTVTAEERRAEREARMADRARVADDRPRGPAGPERGPTTREEARARAVGRFDRMDANGDGRLDADELAAGRGMRRGGGDMPAAPPADRP